MEIAGTAWQSKPPRVPNHTRRTGGLEIDSYSLPVNQRERDRQRIAELRRLARVAQSREPDPVDTRTGPARRWEPEPAAGPRFIYVGPGTPVLLLEEAARRLRLSTGKLEAMAAAGELELVKAGWTPMVPLAEVERLERSETSPNA